jgi:hypothetical protein
LFLQGSGAQIRSAGAVPVVAARTPRRRIIVLVIISRIVNSIRLNSPIAPPYRPMHTFRNTLFKPK